MSRMRTLIFMAVLTVFAVVFSMAVACGGGDDDDDDDDEDISAAADDDDDADGISLAVTIDATPDEAQLDVADLQTQGEQVMDARFVRLDVGSLRDDVRLINVDLPGEANIELELTKAYHRDNGVTWIFRQHNNPEGKLSMMIHVDTGSLNETDAQRGENHNDVHRPPGQRECDGSAKERGRTRRRQHCGEGPGGEISGKPRLPVSPSQLGLPGGGQRNLERAEQIGGEEREHHDHRREEQRVLELQAPADRQTQRLRAEGGRREKPHEGDDARR